VNGTVRSFDEQAGLGDIVDGAGRIWPFHCVEIADGSRTIAVGAAVRFSTRPLLGRYEAVAIVPVG